MLKILLYVIFSAGGLTLLKIGAVDPLGLYIENGILTLRVNVYIVLGLILYMVSFAASLITMKTIDLKFFYPVSAGLVYIVVCVLSYIILKESITSKQLAGMFIIFVGVIVMNL